MLHTALHIALPWKKAGFYFAPHIAVLLVALGIAFATGFFSGAKCGERCLPQFFRAHRHTFMHGNAGLPATIRSLPPRPIKTGGTTTALSGGVHMNIVPSVTDQLNTNSCTEQEFTHAMGYDISWAKQDGARRLVSGRGLYDWINGTTNAANGGNGTSSDQAEAAANVHGVIRHRYYDYPPSPPAPFENAPPSNLPVESHPNWLTWLYISSGGTSDAGLAAIDTALASHHMVGVGMDAYDGPSGLFQAAVTGTYDTANLTNLLGRHMLTFLSFDKTKTINGVTGWYFAQQSWGTRYGLTINGQANDGTNGGYLWVSRRLVKQLSFVAVVVHLGIHTDVYPATGTHGLLLGTPRGPTYVPPSGPTYPAPKVSKPVTFGVPQAGAVAQVYGVKTWDTGVDISASINAAASRYGYSAPGYAALMGTESSFHQYAPHTPINGAGYCDYSGGLTQITVCTAAGLGVGNGTLTKANIDYVFWYEQQDANRDVALSARLVDEFHRQVCWNFATLYAAWNLGPGYGCYASIYQYPTNGITQQAVRNYAGWLQWVYASHVRYGPPPPPPAPKRPRFGKLRATVWEQYRKEHHLPFIAHTGFFAWHWRAGHFQQAGGIVQHETYDARRHVMTEYLQGGFGFWHPGHSRWGVQWKGRSRWLR